MYFKWAMLRVFTYMCKHTCALHNIWLLLLLQRLYQAEATVTAPVNSILSTWSQQRQIETDS